MDYIKYLVITVLSVTLILFIGQTEFGRSFVMGIPVAIIITLLRKDKEAYGVGFFFWIIFLLLSRSIAVTETAEYVAAHPDMKSSPAVLKGMYVIILAILSHPISYALGKFLVWAGNKIGRMKKPER